MYAVARLIQPHCHHCVLQLVHGDLALRSTFASPEGVRVCGHGIAKLTGAISSIADDIAGAHLYSIPPCPPCPPPSRLQLAAPLCDDRIAVDSGYSCWSRRRVVVALGRVMTAICTRSSCMHLLQVTCDACAEEDASKRPDLDQIAVRLMLLLSDDDSSDSDSDSDDSDDEDSNDSDVEPASPAKNMDVSASPTVEDTVSEEVASATALSSGPDEGSETVQDASAADAADASSPPAEEPAEEADDLDFFALLHHHKTNNCDTDWRYEPALMFALF